MDSNPQPIIQLPKVSGSSAYNTVNNLKYVISNMQRHYVNVQNVFKFCLFCDFVISIWDNRSFLGISDTNKENNLEYIVQ